MAQFTIDIPDKALPALQKLADNFNAQTVHDYTVADWLAHHVLGLAISTQLSADAEAIKKELDADFPRQVEARRRELLDALADDKP